MSWVPTIHNRSTSCGFGLSERGTWDEAQEDQIDLYTSINDTLLFFNGTALANIPSFLLSFLPGNHLPHKRS